MTTPRDLGRSITEAVTFLWQVYRDVQSLIVSLDGLLAEKGWRPTEPDRISNDASNKLSDCPWWMIASVYRIYVRDTSRSLVDQCLGVSIYLAPEPEFQEPTLIAFAATLKNKMPIKELWNSWERSSPLREALVGTNDFRRLAQDPTIREFFSVGKEVLAIAIPLCDLADADAVRSVVVDPLLKQADEVVRLS